MLICFKRRLSFLLFQCSAKYWIVLVLLFLGACKSTKYVPEGSYLLSKNRIILKDQSRVTTDELKPYIRQKSNREGLFNIKFFLLQYNLSGADSSKSLNRKLRNWGEPPVIFDASLVQSTKSNLQSFMNERGYYDAEVTDTLIYGKKKLEVIYRIQPKKTFKVKNVSYNISDTVLLNLVRKDSLRSYFRYSRVLSNKLLESEQERLTSMIRNNGFYAFNKSYISFEIDTLNTRSNPKDLTVDVAVNIAGYKYAAESKMRSHNKFLIKDVYVYTNYDALKAIDDSTYLNHFDTLYQKDLYIVYDDVLKLKSNVLSRVNLITPNSYFKESNVTQTYNNISNLNVFKTVTINFKPSNEVDSLGNMLMDCVIQLDPFIQQSYKVDFEVSTNSSELIGFSPGFRYSHLNLLGSAEVFNLDFRGVFQYSMPTASKKQNSFEYNIGSNINLPQFLMPLFNIPYFKIHIPHTKFSSAFVYQNRPDYTRSKLNFTIGYNWKSSAHSSYNISPIDFSMVKVWNLSESFYESIRDPFLKFIYQSHFILGIDGSYTHNSQTQTQREQRSRFGRPSTFFRANGNIAGNLLSAFNSILPTEVDESGNQSHLIFNVPYSQYAKVDFNFVYNKPIQRTNSVAYRLYLGFGKAYGNSRTLPLEKMFYSGGANSLRGWPVRGVGPGSASRDTLSLIPSQVGDMKLEMNVEYRFSIFWIFEGAFFVDGGNIWSYTKSDLRDGAQFNFHTFYKEIALDAGAGLRLNFDYFILRFDLGMKTYDPSRPETSRFIAPQHWFSGNNKSFHFGINYPF